MKNYEKYKNKIKEYDRNKFCNDFVIPGILGSKQKCDVTDCDACHMLQMIWLLEDYKEPKEPEIDWSKIEVDTPILVRQGKNGKWLKKHFAKYENGNVYTWVDGQTSWTGEDKIKWRYAKLPEDEKKPEIDWSKVEVDTPVLVKNIENEEWKKRHFAKYEFGHVHVWNNGSTSWSACHMYDYKYAKLPESEEE